MRKISNKIRRRQNTTLLARYSRDRSAFLFTCPVCGAKSYVDYGFLYHQMEDQIMIHYAASDKDAEDIYDLVTGKTMPDMMKEMVDSNYLIIEAMSLGYDLANLIDNELYRALALVAGNHEADCLYCVLRQACPPS